jgi:hypothetical protein
LKVAVYTIALNEAAHVERWANSATDADYRVVADTGSTDDTIGRLTRAEVTVHQIAVRPWRFDDARNAAMALIPADVDVCLSMDMDEFLAPGWRPKLEAAWKPEMTALYCRKTARSNPDDSTPLKSFPVKNFHRRWGYRFRRPVHEELSFTEGKEVTGDCGEIVIYHVQDHVKSTRKQYLPLMELALQEHPQDAQLYFWLGREYMWAKQPAKGAEMMERYLDLPSSTWPEERSEAMRCLARMQPDKKMHWLDRARIEAPHRRETWLDLAEEFHRQSDWPNLFWAGQNGIERTHRTGSYLDDNHCWGFRLFDLAAIGAWHLNVMDRAVEWGKKAAQLDHDNQRLNNNLQFFTQRREELRANPAIPAISTHQRALQIQQTSNTRQNEKGILSASEVAPLEKSVFYEVNVRHTLEQLDFTGHSAPTALCRLMSSYGSDKAAPLHNYTILYDHLFSQFRTHRLCIFELGIGTTKIGAPSTMGPSGRPGASLRAWREYFDSAIIYGADIDRDVLFAEDRIQTLWVDQTSPDAIRAMWQQLDTVFFDLIIDDGLHNASANLSFFMESVQRIKSGGLYVIEDIRPIDVRFFQSFIQCIATAGKFAGLETLIHPRNNVDNRLMIFQKA